MRTIAEIDASYFSEALEVARAIQARNRRAEALKALAEIDASYFSEALEAAREIQTEDSRARVLIALAKMDVADFSQLLDAARAIKAEDSRAQVLMVLAKMDGADFSQLLDAAKVIQHEDNRALVLCVLAKMDSANFPQLLEAARTIQDEDNRVPVLCVLAQVNATYFPEALEAARVIKNQRIRAEILIFLTKIDITYFSEALKATQAIQDKHRYVNPMSVLARLNAPTWDNFPQLLEMDQFAFYEYVHVDADALSDLVLMSEADFLQLLEAVQTIRDEENRAFYLGRLARMNRANLLQLLEAARAIQDEKSRAEVLSALAQIDDTYFSEALDAARTIQDEKSRAEVLSTLAQSAAYFPKALDAARAIQDKLKRTNALSALSQIDGVNFSQILEVARSIQDQYSYLKLLIRISVYFPCQLVDAKKSLMLVRESKITIMKSAIFLSDISRLNQAYVEDAIDLAYGISDDFDRTLILSEISHFHLDAIKLAIQSIGNLQEESQQLIALRGMARNLPPEFLLQFLDELIEATKNGSINKDILSKLKQSNIIKIKKIKPFLRKEIQRIDSIPGLAEKAKQLHELLPHFPISILPFNNTPDRFRRLWF